MGSATVQALALDIRGILDGPRQDGIVNCPGLLPNFLLVYSGIAAPAEDTQQDADDPTHPQCEHLSSDDRIRTAGVFTELVEATWILGRIDKPCDDTADTTTHGADSNSNSGDAVPHNRQGDGEDTGVHEDCRKEEEPVGVDSNGQKDDGDGE